MAEILAHERVERFEERAMLTLSTLRSAYALVFGFVVSCLLAPAGALAGKGQDHQGQGQGQGQGSGNEFKVRVLVLTTFPGETEPWLTHEQWPLTFEVVCLWTQSNRLQPASLCARPYARCA